MQSLAVAVLVVVELLSPTANEELRDALLVACSDAVAGRCVLDDASDQAPDAVAIVRFDQDRRHANIEVGKRSLDRAVWRRKKLEFSPEDDPVQRFRAVGLTVATLVGEVEPRAVPRVEDPDAAVDLAGVQDARPSSDTPGTATPVERVVPSDSTPEPSPTVTLGFAAGASLAPGLTRDARFGFGQGDWRRGLWTRVSVTPASLPFGFIASLSYSVTPRDDQNGVRVTWLSPRVGAVRQLSVTADVSVAPRLELLLERIVATHDQQSSDQGERWMWGGQLGADVRFPSGWWGVLFGTSIWWLPEGGTAVRLNGTKHGASPGANFAITLGIFLNLPL